MAYDRKRATPMTVALSRMPPPGMTVLASTLTADWSNVHGVLLDGRPEEFLDYSAPFPIITFQLKGVTKVEWKRGGRYSRFVAKPGDLLITPPGGANFLRADAPAESFSCLIDPDRLQALAEDAWTPRGRTVEVLESFNKSDETLWDLGRKLADQLRSPVNGSRLYAEALETQIAIQLLWNYSSLARPADTRSERLADQRLRRAIDYVHESLGENISLEALADVAGLSPNYFLGAFKQATGRTPHRYVIEQRITRACELLRDPHRSITDVSLAVGFSSQSHLTEVFRRLMKTTPAVYRKEAPGLVRDRDEADCLGEGS